MSIEKKIRKSESEMEIHESFFLMKQGGLIIKRRKAFFQTLWVGSFLIWLYIVARVIINHVRLDSLFIDAVPFFTFAILGLIAFVSSMVFMFLYLAQN